MKQNGDEFEFVFPEESLPTRFQLDRKQKKLTDVTIKVENVKTEVHEDLKELNLYCLG